MRLLLAGSPTKFFHLKEFGEELKKQGHEYHLVKDIDYVDGFPNRKISKWFSSNKNFKKLLNEFKPDVIFVDRTKHFTMEASKTDLPLIIHLRGDHWAELTMARETLYKSVGKKIALNKWEEIGEECFKGSTLILPICNHLSKITKQRYPEKSIETMYQGITPERWYHKEGMKLKHPCVGLLQSSTIWGKAQEMLILEKVLKKMPGVTFYWAGDGPYTEKILPVLEKYSNFHWLGSLEYPDKVREYLTEIDVYALVSGIDMSPLTLQEAQLMKKPVVATDVGGIPELMKDNETGFLIEKGNSEQWIEKLSLLLNDKQKRENMGNAGRKFVEENFNWNKITQKFINDLENLLYTKRKDVNS